MNPILSHSGAQELDQKDPLRRFRDEFLLPQTDGITDVYFVGNSLGLQPRRIAEQLQTVLDRWHRSGVHGHFDGEPAWMNLPEIVSTAMAGIVGALPHEVVVMNTLTVNLHLMMATFYQPTAGRHKILIEEHAFPSDHQAVASHLQMRSQSPEQSMVIVKPAAGEATISAEHVIDTIRRHQDSLALILLPGVQYYTGQVFDMPRITAVARELNIPIGFDLAHAAGNIPLQLHDWDMDFACWCTYKYMNSGPGALGGCFIHERHATNQDLPRLAGWWGHERSTRFQMRPEFVPSVSAQGWQLSNPPILALAPIYASLQLFDEAEGIQSLRSKWRRMDGYFRELLAQQLGDRVRILTPNSPIECGCQLSLEVHHEGNSGRQTYERLSNCSVHTDWREPNVIRAAPVPLYNSFEDIWRFVDSLATCLDA